MDSRVTAENHPDDPFGMGTGPTYADRSFGPNQEVIARHNLRPLPWPRSVDLEDEVAELLYHFGIDDDWGLGSAPQQPRAYGSLRAKPLGAVRHASMRPVGLPGRD